MRQYNLNEIKVSLQYKNLYCDGAADLVDLRFASTP